MDMNSDSYARLESDSESDEDTLFVNPSRRERRLSVSPAEHTKPIKTPDVLQKQGRPTAPPAEKKSLPAKNRQSAGSLAATMTRSPETTPAADAHDTLLVAKAALKKSTAAAPLAPVKLPAPKKRQPTEELAPPAAKKRQSADDLAALMTGGTSRKKRQADDAAFAAASEIIPHTSKSHPRRRDDRGYQRGKAPAFDYAEHTRRFREHNSNFSDFVKAAKPRMDLAKRRKSAISRGTEQKEKAQAEIDGMAQRKLDLEAEIRRIEQAQEDFEAQFGADAAQGEKDLEKMRKWEAYLDMETDELDIDIEE